MTEARETRVTLPTYIMGEPNKNPMIVAYRRQKTYPYVMRDNLTDEKKSVEYKALELENEYIKVTVIPEFGGKLYSAYDKRSKKELFYKNNVVKPQLVGLTGAWTAGGIEWNFPIAHRPSTMELVDTAIRNNEDGSASVFVGEVDKITGMKFTIEIVLSPKTSYVEEIVRIYNTTEISRKYYFWNTSAGYETENMEYRYPFKWAITNEFEGARSVWPYYRGMDMRKNKEIYPASAVFGSDVTEDFFGSYDKDIETGLIHVANYQDMPGKKIWSWGMHGHGRMWNRILTDNDGPYVELQSGNVETQNEKRDFQPGKTLTWKEYWFQAYKTGPYTYANKNGLLTTSIKEKENHISLSILCRANRCIDNAVIRVSNANGVIHEETCGLCPEAASEFQVEILKEEFVKGKIAVCVIENNIRIMNYTVKETKSVKEQIDEQLEIQEQYNHKNYVDESQLNKAVDLFRTLKYKDAESLLIEIRNKNEIDDTVNYYLACVKFKLKKYAEAESLLLYAGPQSSFYSSSSSLTGKINLVNGKYERAMEFFEKAYDINPLDYTNVAYYAYSLRKLGLNGKAEKVLRDFLAQDPVNLPLVYELSLLKGVSLQQILDEYNYSPRMSVEDILEVIRLYHQVKDYETALAACDLGCFSLLDYHKAYYLYLMGDMEKSQAALNEAEAACVDYIFPNKDITLEVFEKLSQIYKARNIKYLEGLIYAGSENYDKAVELFEQAEDTFKYSVLNRNLAYILWKQKDDINRACEVLEKGRFYQPLNPDIYIYLNRIYMELGLEEKRLDILSEMEKSGSKHQGIILTMLQIYNDFKMFDKSFELINTYRFRNWEDESQLNIRAIYQNARIGAALKDIEDNNLQSAIENLEKAYVYPENTGLGDSNWSNKAKVHYYLMLCHEALGNLKECLDYCRKVVNGNKWDRKSPDYEYYVKAVNKLVELEWIGLE